MTPACLLVTPRWDPEGGGRERYAAELVAAAARRDVTIQVITHESGARRSRDIAAWRTRHPDVPVLALDPIAGATHYQAHSGVLADSYAAEGRTFRSRLRRSCAPLGLALNLSRLRRLRGERAICTNTATRIMAFSHRDAASLSRRFGTTPSQLTIARPGINLQHFVPPAQPRPAGPIRALFAGHNFHLKGLNVALEAVARADSDVTLTVAGGNRLTPWIRHARRLGLADRVHFAGTVDATTMLHLYQQSDLLLHPAAYDPFPRVILEALACGCPVVTTASCGGAEILRTGHDGWIVEGPDVAGDIVNVCDSLRSPSTRAAAAHNALIAGRQFDFESHVTDVLHWLSPAITAAA